MRWVKHYEDLAEARAEGRSHAHPAVHCIAANFGADWAEDVCSLERIGILRAGTLSVEFMLFAEYCQLVLALVEIFVTAVRARKESERYSPSRPTTSPTRSSLRRAQASAHRLELVKFVSDVGRPSSTASSPSVTKASSSDAHSSQPSSRHTGMVKVLK